MFETFYEFWQQTRLQMQLITILNFFLIFKFERRKEGEIPYSTIRWVQLGNC